MVHKNYKWNISENDARDTIYNLIENILIEKKDQEIEVSELSFLLNNRTKDIEFYNNKKKKNITNYMKVVFGGLVGFIDDYDNFLLCENDKKQVVKLNKIELSDWIFVNEDE
tara:strand:+ start:151 stop:486 length:336 start_codon:yes stop_codon:yes gene_type:complete